MDNKTKEMMLKIFPKVIPGSIVNVPCKVSSFTLIDGDNGESARLRLHPIGFRTLDIECNSIEKILNLFEDLNNESTSTESCESHNIPVYPKFFDESKEYILNMRVDDMLFKAKQETGDTVFKSLNRTKVSNILRREGIIYVKDLIKFSLEDISSIKGFGCICFSCLTTSLNHFNIKLKGEENG